MSEWLLNPNKVNIDEDTSYQWVSSSKSWYQSQLQRVGSSKHTHGSPWQLGCNSRDSPCSEDISGIFFQTIVESMPQHYIRVTPIVSITLVFQQLYQSPSSKPRVTSFPTNNEKTFSFQQESTLFYNNVIYFIDSNKFIGSIMLFYSDYLI